MQMSVPIEQLLKEPFIRIIGYPYSSDGNALEDARERVEEMDALGVKSILLGGRSMIHGLNVLGKGCTSIVVKALLDTQRNGACKNSRSSSVGDDVVNNNGNDGEAIVVALKMMRRDSGRASMKHEADMLAIANKVGIGPRLMAYSRNLLAMELIDGMHMFELIRKLEGSKASGTNPNHVISGVGGISSNNDCHPLHIRSILKDILEQCFLLDSIGLDHGELSNMDRHVMISDRAYIIDFESSSITRRVANVTSAASYLLFGRGSIFADMLNLYTRNDEIICALRRYRLDTCRERFDELLTLLDLKFKIL